jgi:hypothetical protein
LFQDDAPHIFLSRNSFILVQRLSWDFGSCGIFFIFFISGSIVYALHQIMHKAGLEQHRIFGLEKIKKKLWTIVQFCLSDWLHLAQTAVLDSIPLSFSLHLHGMGTILTSIRKIIPVKYVYIQNQVRNVQIVYSSLMTILVILKWPFCFEFNWMQLSWKN